MCLIQQLNNVPSSVLAAGVGQCRLQVAETGIEGIEGCQVAGRAICGVFGILQGLNDRRYGLELLGGQATAIAASTGTAAGTAACSIILRTILIYAAESAVAVELIGGGLSQSVVLRSIALSLSLREKKEHN